MRPESARNVNKSKRLNELKLLADHFQFIDLSVENYFQFNIGYNRNY